MLNSTDHRACPQGDLAVYQHVALDGDLEAKYQATMKEIDLAMCKSDG